MPETDETMTRYLLGELSEAEQSRLEERYFTDAQAFNQLVQLETELVDGYARDRLTPRMRARFERAYLVNPNRRARLRFGAALAAKLDEAAASRAVGQTNLRAPSWRQRFFSSITGGRRALAVSMALALLLLSTVSVWLFIQSRRLRQDLARTRDAQAAQQQREREAQQQLADEQKRNQELTAELGERAGTAPQPQPPPSPTAQPAPVVASLVLTASGIRGVDTGAPARLVIPQGARQVRLQLNLSGNDYQSYQLVLQAVGGREVFNRPRVKPINTRTGASFVVALPASKVSAGDYILTLKGFTAGGELEDVSQSIFHVEKK
ncbi:MAG: hypothetical protein LC746_02950 [Acidobacteria bacterium]|nr:hypothetical protein [Acidobacteriota bacterium]